MQHNWKDQVCHHCNALIFKTWNKVFPQEGPRRSKKALEDPSEASYLQIGPLVMCSKSVCARRSKTTKTTNKGTSEFTDGTSHIMCWERTKGRVWKSRGLKIGHCMASSKFSSRNGFSCHCCPRKDIFFSSVHTNFPLPVWSIKFFNFSVYCQQ